MVQRLLPNNDAIFQDDNSHTHTHTHTTRSVQSWFDEHGDALQHLPWPSQSPYLNIIEPVWLVLESRLKSRFPPQSFLKQLEDALHEVWSNISLEAVHNLHESIPRSTEAV